MTSETTNVNNHHLTDDQFAAALADKTLSSVAGQHLAVCSECRAEQQRWQQMFGAMRGQIAATAERPPAFWSWQLQATLERAHPRRKRLVPAFAGMLALLAMGLLLLQSPVKVSQPIAQQRASEFADPMAASAALPSDAALLAEVERTLQAPPMALQPAALLAQELMAAQFNPVSVRDANTRPEASEGGVQ
ncbi:MAG: hypothetical protein AB7O65_07220 [Candidatus Korobacteraceae bacterium]